MIEIKKEGVLLTKTDLEFENQTKKSYIKLFYEVTISL